MCMKYTGTQTTFILMGENVGCAVLHRDLIYSKKLTGYTSIYNAELRAVLKAVKLAKNDPLSQSTVIFTDSQSVKNSIEQRNSDHPLIVEILHTILEMSMLGKSVMVCWVPAHIGDPQNEKVDREAKAAAENDSPVSSAAVHYRDLYPAVRVNLQNEWEQSWIELTDNNLRDIKDNTRVWNSSLQKGRKTEVVLTILRIGHTRLTHSWLIDRTQPPVCLMCDVPLSVKHILVECAQFLDLRRRLYPQTVNMGVPSVMKKILSEKSGEQYNVTTLIHFITQTGLLDKI